MHGLKMWVFLALGLFPVLVVDGGAIFGSSGGASLNAGCQPVKRDELAARMGTNFKKQFMTESVEDSPHAVDSEDSPRGNITKRNSPLPDPIQWTCQTHKVWEDLGLNHYPRYLMKTKCNSSTCWFGHFSCRPKVFQVQVLKRKDGKCNLVQQSGAVRFEDYWEFVPKDVSYHCECGH